MRSARTVVRRALEFAAVGSTVGWGLGCMLATIGPGDPPDDVGSVDNVEPRDTAEPAEYADGTTLLGIWSGPVECPSGTGTLVTELAEVGPWAFEGPATFDVGDPVEVALAATYDGADGPLRDVSIEVDACDICPRFEGVVWDLETLPAVIDGELYELVTGEVCVFELHARSDR